MGEKSKKGGWSLPWGKSTVNKVQKCDSCQEEAQKLQYAPDSKAWICAECSDRPMLEKGSMFGMIRPVTAKEHDHQHSFVQNTKFDS